MLEATQDPRAPAVREKACRVLSARADLVGPDLRAEYVASLAVGGLLGD